MRESVCRETEIVYMRERDRETERKRERKGKRAMLDEGGLASCKRERVCV